MPAEGYADDATIADEEVLWRRLIPEWVRAEGETVRISEGAFRTHEMSVHIASLTSAGQVLASYPGVRLARFTAGDVRATGCILFRAPTEEDPSHAIVCRRDHRPDNPRRLTGSQAKGIANRCTVLDPERGD